MRRVSAAWLLVLLLLAGGAHAQARAFAAPPDTGRATWFLDMLKALSDVDGLSDPDKVGAILGVRFSKTVLKTSPSHMEAFAKSFERDEYVPVTKTWFVAGPPGYARTGNFRPNGQSGYSAGADPVARGDAVNFKYFQSRRYGLPEQDSLIMFDRVKDDSETSVIFYGIDKLACITVQDVQARFPGIRHMVATDASAERYVYHARLHEDAGTVITFTAPQGRCMTDASAEEFSSFGKRHGRAQVKFNACLKEAATAYCAQYPKATLLGNLTEIARQRCDGLQSLFDKEPRTNVMPPADHFYVDLPPTCPYPEPPGSRR